MGSDVGSRRKSEKNDNELFDDLINAEIAEDSINFVFTEEHSNFVFKSILKKLIILKLKINLLQLMKFGIILKKKRNLHL